jgi:hypothetical protein
MSPPRQRVSCGAVSESARDEFPGPALPPLPPFPLFEINDLLEKNSAPGRSQTLPGVRDVEPKAIGRGDASRWL